MCNHEDWNQFGTPLEARDMDDVLTRSVADPMGRVFGNWTETGAWERVTFRAGSGTVCPAGTAYYSHVRTGGGSSQYSCFDVLRRETRTAKAGFNGGLVFTDTGFDRSGRPERVSEPYLSGQARYWNITLYDQLGRISLVDAAGGNDVSMAYGADVSGRCGVDSPFAVETINGLGQSRIEVGNAMGEIVAVYDSQCGEARYRYDAIGNLLEVTGADGNRVSMVYDLAGRRVLMDDPDKGVWQYAWNGLGEMLRQLDGQRQSMDFEYDSLGRVTRRLELRGVDSIDDTAYSVQHVEESWWQNSVSAGVRGKGQPTRITYREGVAGEVLHRQLFEYDDLGRLSETRSTVGGLEFSEENTYDQFGRKFQAFDASGDYRGVRYRYNEYGYLDQLAEARDGSEAIVYLDIEGMDARGNMSYALLGNGVEVFADHDEASGQLEMLEAYDASGRELQHVRYEFDVLGNLVQRTDLSDANNLTENFSYDDLNRLLRVELTAPAQGIATPTQTLAMQYGVSGNITYKSDVGAFHYDEGSAGPHAVTRAGNNNYSYDANGNQVSGNGREIEYSTFDKPTRIVKGGQVTEFRYGIAHRRIARVDDNEVDGTKTRLYIGGVEYTDDGNSTFFSRHVAGVAEVKFFPATKQSKVAFAVKDHLGSTHNLTDESGSVESAVWLAFSAFGQRRASNWTASLTLTVLSELNSLSNRGFTGHEHVDAMGLVHMNGRIYDPELGRFLQADPVVQAALNTQTLNRYTYALNNPLSLTDPSGYFFERLVKRWGRVIAAMVISAVLPGTQGILATVFNLTNPVAQAAITGFIAGAITSGTLKGAVIGSLTAVAVAGIVKAHSSAVQGEKMAEMKDIIPDKSTIEHLHGHNGETKGLFRVKTAPNGAFDSAVRITSADMSSGDVIFTNGVKNSFADAVKNGTIHLHQNGLLGESFILNFNPSRGFVADLLEASRDIAGAHTGLGHSGLAKDLAGLIDDVSTRGINGLHLVGHSQGGVITASALRYAGKAGLNVSALSGGGVALHGAPVNAWMARERLGGRLGIGIESHHQFGDAVHVLGGLNLTNPLEVPISLLRAPALFSGDPSINPHSMPCGNRTSLVCAH